MFIEIQNVSKSFLSRTGRVSRAVDDFSLNIERGEFLCLLGPSGCGKTTILTMLAGFDHPTTGDIFLEGKRVKDPSRDRGVVFQGDTLHSLHRELIALRELSKQATGEESELTAGLDNLHEIVAEVVEHYEATCNQHGIALPYPKG